MTPHWLRLKNFTGIRSGLGLEELVLDLDSTIGDAQLVAIVGPNGAGKSTVLDNLHPFRVMPSRASSYSPGSFSYYDNVAGAEASKELVWSHNVTRYRSVLNFKMGGKTKKTEAYLFVIGPDGQDAPASLPDGTRSDGKTETYDRCVNAILGTPEMFFTSVFAAQNRRSLSSYTNGEIKGLLSELLNLDDITALGKKAGDVAKSLRIRLDAMRDDLVAVERTESEREQASTKLEGLTATASMLAVFRTQARFGVSAAVNKLAQIRANLGAGAEVEARRASLHAQYNGVQQRSGATLRQLDLDIDTERRRLHDTIESLRGDITKATAQSASLRRQIIDNEHLLSRRAEIESARTELAALDANIQAARQAVETARTVELRHRDLVLEQGRLRAELQSLATEGQSKGYQCQAVRERAGLIDKVPCHGTDLQPRCPLLKDACAARDNLPEAEAEANAKRGEYATVQERGKPLTAEIDAMGDTQTGVRQATARIDQINERIRALNSLVNESGKLEMAERTIATARASLVDLENVIADKAKAIDEANTGSTAKFEDLSTRRATIEQEAEAERAALHAELDNLPPPADMSAIAEAEAAVTVAEARQAEADRQYDENTATMAGTKEAIRHLTSKLADAARLKTTAAMIESEIACWTTLTKALGPDGIIALAIDDAGPSISALANDLLLSCYGPRFSVRIATQEQTAKGDLKEAFDIRVFDAERDDEKSVRDMSGGERIWINECLTRAIALFQAGGSGQSYGTLFADESDGALDPDRKQMFVAMKRKVLELGGYGHEFFISHSPELWDMADAVIDMGKLKETSAC